MGRLGNTSILVFALSMGGSTSPAVAADVLTIGVDSQSTLLPAGGAYAGDLAGLADVNGDGRDDFVFTGSHNRIGHGNVGFVGIVFGRHCLSAVYELPVQEGYDVVIRGDRDFGFNFRIGLGDYNGDGIADILRPADSLYHAHVVFGRSKWPSLVDLAVTPPDVHIISDADYGLGLDYFASGDFNGDGIDDFAIGSPSEYNGTPGSNGAVYLFFGDRNLPAVWETAVMPPSLTLRGHECGDTGDGLGYFFGMGDINADGLDDLLMYTEGPEFCSLGRTLVRVVFGSVSPNPLRDLNVDPEDLLVLLWPGRGGPGAITVADVDGDAIGDLLLGTPFLTVNGRHDAGRLDVLLGRKSYPPTLDVLTDPTRWSVIGPARERYFGQDVLVGDVDDNGLADVLLGCHVEPHPDGSGSKRGQLHEYLGRTFWPLETDLAVDPGDRVVTSNVDQSYVGGKIFLGDVNGRGVIDVVLGVHQPEAVYVFLGEQEPAAPDFPATSTCRSLGKGFWHRQCLSPGMSGPVSGRAPFHPRFPAADILKFFETADAWLECHELAPACELLDKGPASDPCARALEQLASVLLDAASGTLGLDCQADTGKLLDSSDPRRPGTVAELLELVTGLAATGVADDCRLADRLAGSVKSGGVVVPLAVTVPGPASGGGPTGHASVRGSGK